mmetsp:Transcript_39348/g.58460  ORF Transcript_39348/g.58460 Transcript_39348/m.58460 type:complete len:169 (+) Transcript_39348:1825-2331(+)
MKKTTKNKRDHTRNKSKAAFARLLKKAQDGNDITENDLKDSEKARKGLVGPDELVYGDVLSMFKDEKIHHFSVPFEAEWQLVFFEQECWIDYIISEDSDLVALGAEIVLVDVKFGKDDKTKPSFKLFSRQELLASASSGSVPLSNYEVTGTRACSIPWVRLHWTPFWL